MVAVAAEAGLDLSTSGIDGAHKEPTYQWTYSQAVFFTFTTLAMIGKKVSTGLFIVSVTFDTPLNF